MDEPSEQANQRVPADVLAANALASEEKRSVALSSVLAAVFLTGMKLVVGLMTGSLGILSEAAHSALDLVAAVVTFLAVRVSARPADREHTYGHGKIENLSALFETLLLLATCVWIVIEAGERLFVKEVEVDVTAWAFAIMVISIVVDFSRSRALGRVAKKYNSQALEADALHFSTDIWSSSVVLVGLGVVLLARWTGQPWLQKADTIAALGVAAIVVWVCVKLGRKTIGDLLDEISPGTRDEVQRALQIPGVVEVARVRVRRSGPKNFVDVTLQVEFDTSLARGHEIASAAEVAVQRHLPGADVMVHVEPSRPASWCDVNELHALIRETAARVALGAHDIHLHEVLGKRSLEVHLEVSEALCVAAAHDQATTFEKALRQTIPSLDSVVTHIEPARSRAVPLDPAPLLEKDVIAVLDELVRRQPGPCHPHDIKVHQVGDDLVVSLHCTLDPNTAISEAHEFTETVEHTLRVWLPRISRVVIHVEPPEPGSVPGPA